MRRRPITRLGLQIPSFTYPGVSDDKLFEKIAEIAAWSRVLSDDEIATLMRYACVRYGIVLNPKDRRTPITPKVGDPLIVLAEDDG